MRTRNNMKAPIPDWIIKRMSEKDRKFEGVELPSERIAKGNVRKEKDLQKTVENWLHLHGYSRRSPMDITYIKPKRGWAIHLYKTKCNPLLLDILLLRNDGEWCEFELKIPGGRWSSKEQQILCEFHGHPVFTDLEQVIEYVTAWENERR